MGYGQKSSMNTPSIPCPYPFKLLFAILGSKVSQSMVHQTVYKIIPFFRSIILNVFSSYLKNPNKLSHSPRPKQKYQPPSQKLLMSNHLAQIEFYQQKNPSTCQYPNCSSIKICLHLTILKRNLHEQRNKFFKMLIFLRSFHLNLENHLKPCISHFVVKQKTIKTPSEKTYLKHEKYFARIIPPSPLFQQHILLTKALEEDPALPHF